SLPRPDDLIEAWGRNGEAALAAKLTSSVADVVRRQKEIGIDVPGDGEFGKPMAQAGELRFVVEILVEPPRRPRSVRPQLVRDGAQALLAGPRRTDELWRSPRPYPLRRSLWRSRLRHYDRPEAARPYLCRSDPLCRARRNPEGHRQFQGG